MCTASILTRGFHIVIAAYDNMAGINYNEKSDVPSLTYLQKEISLKKFSCRAVNGNSCFKRSKGGVPLPQLFKDHHIQRNIFSTVCFYLCLKFNSYVGRNEINFDPNPDDLKNHKTLPDNHPIRTVLKTAYPYSLEYSCTRSQPDSEIAHYPLEQIQQDKKQNGPGNAVALLDYFVNLLLCLPGAQHISTIRTDFLETTRTYAGIRYQLS